MIQPMYERNKKYVASNGMFKKLVTPKLYYQTSLMQPKGKGPCGRYMHSACYMKSIGKQGSIAIYGGKNTEVFQETHGNIALNDLHMYDISMNQWLTIAIYGEIPNSRWGHQIVSGQNKIYIMGGINLKSYCETAIFEVIFDKQHIAMHYEEYEVKQH